METITKILEDLGFEVYPQLNMAFCNIGNFKIIISLHTTYSINILHKGKEVLTMWNLTYENMIAIVKSHIKIISVCEEKGRYKTNLQD